MSWGIDWEGISIITERNKYSGHSVLFLTASSFGCDGSRCRWPGGQFAGHFYLFRLKRNSVQPMSFTGQARRNRYSPKGGWSRLDGQSMTLTSCTATRLVHWSFGRISSCTFPIHSVLSFLLPMSSSWLQFLLLLLSLFLHFSRWSLSVLSLILPASFFISIPNHSFFFLILIQ